MINVNDIEKYYNEDGQVGVLISRGGGAGFGTWCSDLCIAWDKRVIEFWLEHKDDKRIMNRLFAFSDNKEKEDITNLFKSFGYERVYLGGFPFCELIFVDKGEPFRIEEHDGNERLCLISDDDIITF